jgi:sulfite reductase (NADPH) flavoprotein alpha-component
VGNLPRFEWALGGIHKSRHAALGLRTGLFWLHLVLGVLVGIAVTPVAATGALMSFQPELIAWFENDVRVVDLGAPRLPPSELLRRAATELPSDTKPNSLQLERSRSAPAILGAEDGFWLLDPFDGHVLRPSAVRHFFLLAEEVHWTIGLVLVNLRGLGTALAGLVAIAVLLLSLTGPWLWWPQKLTRAQLRSRLWFSRTSSATARSLGWHHVIGIWCTPFVAAASLTGILLHYQGVRDGVGALLGGTAAAQVKLDTDSAVREAIARAPDWSALRLWWDDDGAMTLRVRFSRGARPTQWAELDSSPADGSAVRNVTLRRYQDGRTGDKVLGWARWAHTGQALGRIGQAAWGVGALGVLVLVWTGIALSIWRVRRWFTRKARAQQP